jgi:hypothetical protein
MMRSYFAGLAILIGGVLGLFGTSLLAQALIDEVFGPGTSAGSEPLVRLVALLCVVLPPLLVARVLLGRGRKVELGLFLVGWGCFWPIAFAYLAFLALSARLSGGAGPTLDLAGDPESVFVYIFFAVLPLVGLWLATAGLRQHRAGGVVIPS